MSVHYELRSTGVIQASDLASELVEVSADDAAASTLPIVEVLTPGQFCQLGLEDCNDLTTSETLTNAESNYVDIYQNHVMGSFSVPSRSIEAVDPDTFAFFLNKHKLVFVDNGTTAEEVLSQIVQAGVLRTTSTIHCLYVFMKYLMLDDLDYLGTVEDGMEDLEEAMMDLNNEVRTSQIMGYRRLSMRFAAFYQQLATMAAMLSDNENKMMTREEARQFDHIENLADRLSSRADTLREYSLQLHELHQTHIDLRQNSIMQLLTIVTVMLAPMTLVTGWFGMNLTTLPGESVPFMWAALIGLFFVCAGGLLVLFHRKRWL